MMKVLIQGAMLVGVVLGIGWGALFGPHYIDYWQIDEVVGTAALSWTVFDIVRCKNDMSYEMNRMGIESVSIDDCSFNEARGLKTVSCQWKVDVEIPLVGQTRRISFDVEKSAGPDGRLVE